MACSISREEGGLYRFIVGCGRSRMTIVVMVLLAINGVGEGMAVIRKAQRAS